MLTEAVRKKCLATQSVRSFGLLQVPNEERVVVAGEEVLTVDAQIERVYAEVVFFWEVF